MEPIATVLGVGIISFLLIYLSFKLDDNHAILKIATLLMAFVLLLLIPKVLIDHPSNCEIVIDGENVTQINANLSVTDYSYKEYCGVEKITNKTFFKTYFGIYLLLMMYSTTYLVYYVFKKMKTRK